MLRMYSPTFDTLKKACKLLKWKRSIAIAKFFFCFFLFTFTLCFQPLSQYKFVQDKMGCSRYFNIMTSENCTL